MKKIAVIISQIEEGCQSLIWDGIVAAAEKCKVELITLPAYSYDNDIPIKTHYTMLQSFITHHNFSGVILFTGAMSEYTPWPVVKRYAESIQLPLVTIAGNIETGSNIIIDNHFAVIEQITHLVEVHNRRNIAYVKGPESNEEAAERYNAYLEALTTNNLQFDEHLVLSGDFSEDAGSNAIEKLEEQGTFYDAVVCGDDYTAIGVLKALKKHNKSVPQDVSVVGFDDIPEASMQSPALSTIQQPFHLQGETALETLLDILQTEPQDQPQKENTIILNPHTIYRSSCGCNSEEVRQFRENWHAEHAQKDRTALSEFLTQTGALIALQLSEIELDKISEDEYRKMVLDETTQLWNSFFNEVENHVTDTTLQETLTDILYKNHKYTTDLSIWQAILSNFGPFIFHFKVQQSQLLASAILEEARIILDTFEKRNIQIESYEKMSIDESIRESCTSIIMSSSQKEILKNAAEAFNKHQFSNAFIALFNPYSPIPHEEWHLPGQLYAQLCITNGESIEISRNHKDLRFASTDIIPSKFCENFKSKNTLFLPIYMQSQYFGYIIAEIVPHAPKELYSELQIHISSAYRSCFMLDNLRALSMNDDLTGLSNRRGFMLLANQLQAKSVNTGVDLLFFYFDMDNLKVINDRFSHEDGDHAIKSTASLLRRTFRNHDIIGRIGGDEFLAIIEETVPGLEKIMGLRLQKLIDTFNTHSGLPYKIEISTGTATLKVSGSKSVDEVIKEADHSMFINKKERKKGRE